MQTSQLVDPNAATDRNLFTWHPTVDFKSLLAPNHLCLKLKVHPDVAVERIPIPQMK